jgi:hypothetical protein
MLADGVHPRAEPRRQRLGQLHACRGVRREDLPLLVGRESALVEEARLQAEPADVVQQGCPAQLGGVPRRQPELPADQGCVGLDAFGVAPGGVVVLVDGRDQVKEKGGVVMLTVELLVTAAHRLDALAEHLGGVAPARDGEPARSLVGEVDRQSQQGAQGQEAPTRAPRDQEQHRRQGNLRSEPHPQVHAQALGGRPACRGQAEHDRAERRHSDDQHPDAHREGRVRLPLAERGVVIVLRWT